MGPSKTTVLSSSASIALTTCRGIFGKKAGGRIENELNERLGQSSGMLD
jgi:hypothetical protein